MAAAAPAAGLAALDTEAGVLLHLRAKVAAKDALPSQPNQRRTREPAVDPWVNNRGLHNEGAWNRVLGEVDDGMLYESSYVGTIGRPTRRQS